LGWTLGPVVPGEILTVTVAVAGSPVVDPSSTESLVSDDVLESADVPLVPELEPEPLGVTRALQPIATKAPIIPPIQRMTRA